MSVDFSSKVGSVSFRGSLGQATKPRYRRPAMFQEAVAIILDPSTPRKEASYHISQWGGKENVTEETLQSWRELSFFVKDRGSNHFEAIRFGTISLRNMPDNLLLDLLKNDDCRGALTVGQVGQIGRGFYSSLELSDLALVVKLFERLGVSVEDKKWGFIGRAALTHINKLFGDYFSAVSRTSEDETMGVVAGEIKKAVDGSLWPVVFRFLESEESQKMLFKESDPQGGLYKDLPEILDRVAKDGYTEILWHGSDKWQSRLARSILSQLREGDATWELIEKYRERPIILRAIFDRFGVNTFRGLPGTTLDQMGMLSILYGQVKILPL